MTYCYSHLLWLFQFIFSGTFINTSTRPTNYSRMYHTDNSKTNMNILSPQDITTRDQWHEWFAQRRIRLQTRLKQAEQAEWNWPCTRRRCEIMRIEDEIKELDLEEFVVPF